MIYNKPRDLSWKVLPTFGFSKPRKQKKSKNTSTTDNLINTSAPQRYPDPKLDNVDIILDGKPKFIKELEVDENTIIDLTTMPVIEGIPMLQFPEEPYKEPEDVKTTSSPPMVDVPEKQKSKTEKKTKTKVKKAIKTPHKLKIASFFLMLYFGAVVSFIIPTICYCCRSSVSDIF